MLLVRSSDEMRLRINGTPLHLAVDEYGDTSFHVIARYLERDNGVITLFKRHGADLDTENNLGVHQEDPDRQED